VRARTRPGLAALTAAALLAVGAIVAPGAGAGQAAKPKPKVVKVRDDYFSPTTVKAKAGKTVKWAWGNSNIDSHNVTLLKGPKGVKKSKFRSITGAVGIHYQPKFKKPGTYTFYCTIHPEVMRMKVVIKKKK
jgi:plastocyanin